LDWIKLHNEKFYALDSSPDIVRATLSVSVTWMTSVACKRDQETHVRCLFQNVKEPYTFDILSQMGAYY